MLKASMISKSSALGCFSKHARRNPRVPFDVGREIFRNHLGKMHAARPEHGAVVHRARADVVDAGQPGAAMAAQIIGNDAPAIRPAGQHRLFQAGRFDHGGDIVGPKLVRDIGLAVDRLSRRAMPAQVERDHAEFARKGRIGELPRPRQMRLVEAVNEQDLAAVRIAPFLDRDRYAVGGFDCGWLHGLPGCGNEVKGGRPRPPIHEAPCKSR